MLKTVKFLLQVGFISNFVLSNCVSSFSKFHTDFLPNCTVFFRLLNRNLNEDSKNMLKTVIFLLQVSFPGVFVADSLFKLCFWQFKT